MTREGNLERRKSLMLFPAKPWPDSVDMVVGSALYQQVKHLTY